MCSPARCSTCGKVTWSGCGEHVDAVMAAVPRNQQCTCR
jgi:DNA-directed RNA polymerase subunit N (RpoN/RPB10)